MIRRDSNQLSGIDKRSARREERRRGIFKNRMKAA
jgi:hypothetical protein